MIKVTEAAKEELKKKLEANTDKPDFAIRLQRETSGRLGLALDKESPADQIIECQGKKVLLIDLELAATLEGFEFDVEETSEGTKLVMNKEKPGEKL